MGPLVTREPVTVSGYIRFPEAAGALTPPENPLKRLWFTRDHLAMARALGWGEGGRAVAPFYIDLEAPVPASGCGSRRITRPMAFLANARLCVVTGPLPVLATNCERNTKKSFNLPTVPSISARTPASAAELYSLNRLICRSCE